MTDTPMHAWYQTLLRAISAGDAEKLVEGWYHEDAILTTFDGIHSGREALLAYFRSYLPQHAGMQILSTEHFLERSDACYSETRLAIDTGEICAYNGYVVRAGKITHQFAGVK